MQKGIFLDNLLSLAKNSLSGIDLNVINLTVSFLDKMMIGWNVAKPLIKESFDWLADLIELVNSSNKVPER